MDRAIAVKIRESDRLGICCEDRSEKFYFLPIDWNVVGDGKAVYVAIALVCIDIFSVINRSH